MTKNNKQLSIEKRGFWSRISDMFLKRKFVALLQDYHIKRGWAIAPATFLEYAIKRKWPRLNYPFLTNDEYKRLIDLTLVDCIKGDKKYIGYTNNLEQFLQVTPEGRKFIKWPFFFSEMALEHKGLAILFGSGFATIVIWIFNIFIQT